MNAKDEFNHSGHRYVNPQVDQLKGFLSTSLLEEISPRKFRIGIDLRTSEAGLEDIIVDKESITTLGEDFTSRIKHRKNYEYAIREIEYDLVKLEPNKAKVRRILKYYKEKQDLIQCIFNNYNQERHDN